MFLAPPAKFLRAARLNFYDRIANSRRKFAGFFGNVYFVNLDFTKSVNIWQFLVQFSDFCRLRPFFDKNFTKKFLKFPAKKSKKFLKDKKYNRPHFRFPHNNVYKKPLIAPTLNLWRHYKSKMTATHKNVKIRRKIAGLHQKRNKFKDRNANANRPLNNI